MRRYILRQYRHGEPSHDPANVTGTFDELKGAKLFAGLRLLDFNEVIDRDTWEVVWRLNKSAFRALTAPLQLSIGTKDLQQPASGLSWKQ